jgi:hypothetical protein
MTIKLGITYGPIEIEYEGRERPLCVGFGVCGMKAISALSMNC